MKIKQYSSNVGKYSPSITIVPPLADDFEVYGGTETTERAREWALMFGYVLVTGVSPCAHGMYMMECPCNCLGSYQKLDHSNMWVNARPRFENGQSALPAPNAFILAHPYGHKSEDESLKNYAQAHGLTVGSLYYDNWYGAGTSPVRLTTKERYLWPIDKEVSLSLAILPIEWPDENDTVPEWMRASAHKLEEQDKDEQYGS